MFHDISQLLNITLVVAQNLCCTPAVYGGLGLLPESKRNKNDDKMYFMKKSDQLEGYE